MKIDTFLHISKDPVPQRNNQVPLWMFGFLSLLLNAERAIVFTDDDISFVHGNEAFARIHREHREAHAEVRRQDFVSAETFHFGVVRAGVEEFLDVIRYFRNKIGDFVLISKSRLWF